MFKIFPNPFFETFRIEYFPFENGSLTVFGLDGKILEQFVLSHGLSDDLGRNLNKGSYLLEVNSANSFQRVMMIKL